MTTQSWSTDLQHTNDATFRAWGSELAAMMAAAGLVNTSDTGQINWATVTRAGTNADAGYEIWRMNDTEQGTAPVYFRIAYGTANSATIPRIRITTGTGTDGAGTITGTALQTVQIASPGTTPASGSWQSYLCVTDGAFWFAWKRGAATANQFQGAFFFSRSVDAAGVPTALGCYILFMGMPYQYLRFAATAATYPARSAAGQLPCIVPGQPSSSLVGSDNQAYLHWMAIPEVLPVLFLCTVIATEATAGSTFAATLVGSTSHMYVSLVGSGAADSSAGGGYALAAIWE